MTVREVWSNRCERVRRICTWIVGVELLLLFPIPMPIGYIAMLNWLGPSTEYHNPEIATAVPGPDGRPTVYVGDEFYVWISIVRHKLNGNCLFDIRRYAEATEEPNQGVPRLISRTQLQFVGQNELRRTRWPVPSERYILGYEVDDNRNPLPDKPLLPDDVEQQEFDFYVVGRYYCNALDYVIPRYIQGGNAGHPDQTGRVRAVVKRTKP